MRRTENYSFTSLRFTSVRKEKNKINNNKKIHPCLPSLPPSGGASLSGGEPQPSPVMALPAPNKMAAGREAAALAQRGAAPPHTARPPASPRRPLAEASAGPGDAPRRQVLSRRPSWWAWGWARAPRSPTAAPRASTSTG